MAHVEIESAVASRTLQDFWTLRRRGHLKEPQKLIRAELRSIGVSYQSIIASRNETLTTLRSLPTDSAICILTAVASVEHGESRPANARRVLYVAKEFLGFDEKEYPFQLLFELGLSAAIATDFTGALRLWLSAQTLAWDTEQRTLCLLNSILAYEYLGLNALSLINQKFAEDLQSLSDVQPSLMGQWQAYQLRQNFRIGRLPDESNTKDTQEAIVTQADYLQAYYCMLPWRDGGPCLNFARQYIEKLHATQEGYRASLRIQSLTTTPPGLPKFDGFKPGDVVLTCYLWLWNWMGSGVEGWLKGVITGLDYYEQKFKTSHLSYDEQQLLIIIQAWLSLMSSRTLPTTELCMGSIMPETDLGASLFTFERLIIAYHYARRDGDTSTAQVVLRAWTKLQAQGLVTVPKLFEALLRPETLETTLAHQLCEIAYKPSTAHSIEPSLMIDRLRGNVSAKGKVLSSEESLVDTLTLFANADRVAVQEIVITVFGSAKYDPLKHDNRLAKHLLKFNKTFEAHMRLRRSGPYICADGSLPILIHRDGKLARQASRYLIPLLNDGLKKQLRASRSDESSPTFSRSQLEKLWGLSASSTQRRLESLIRDQHVIRSGTGTQVRYKFPGPIGPQVPLPLTKANDPNPLSPPTG